MLVFKTSQFAQNSIQVAIQRYDEAKGAHPLQISLKVEHAIETAGWSLIDVCRFHPVQIALLATRSRSTGKRVFQPSDRCIISTSVLQDLAGIYVSSMFIYWDNAVLFFNLDYFTMINICSVCVCVFETAHLRWSWFWEKKCSRMKKRRAAMITAVALQQRNTTNIHQRKRRGETASTSIIRCTGKDPPICPWTLWFCLIFLLYSLRMFAVPLTRT